MIIENWKAELEKNLPDVEKFLTSVLQEDAKISVESVNGVDKKEITKSLNKNDIYVFAKDETHDNSIILVLDQEWFGLLSSIMMGVEEKKNNEITRDLLKKFASELTVALKKSTRRNGLRFTIDDIEVFTFKQLEKRFEHGEYFHAKMQVSGLADEDVRAELLLGNPDVRIDSAGSDDEGGEEDGKKAASSKKENADTGSKKQKKAGPDGGATGGKTDGGTQEPTEPASGSNEPVPESNEPVSEKLFTGMDAENMDDKGSGTHIDEDQVISGRKVEFDNFDYSAGEIPNGHSRSMALLKDVEMDVSVQLGQIEMPLGKVLQLAKGSIIELDKLAGEPVDILVNGYKIAQGEVVVIDEHFGVRITNLITTRERIASLK